MMTTADLAAHDELRVEQIAFHLTSGLADSQCWRLPGVPEAARQIARLAIAMTRRMAAAVPERGDWRADAPLKDARWHAEMERAWNRFTLLLCQREQGHADAQAEIEEQAADAANWLWLMVLPPTNG